MKDIIDLIKSTNIELNEHISTAQIKETIKKVKTEMYLLNRRIQADRLRIKECEEFKRRLQELLEARKEYLK